MINSSKVTAYGSERNAYFNQRKTITFSVILRMIEAERQTKLSLYSLRLARLRNEMLEIVDKK
jgi:hypothetical protein